MSGRVILVGAGPGDPELLTLKAVHALATADVILVDDLANRAALVHARADARVIPVGKRGGCLSTPQAFIERLMLAEARAGRTVVRLKGGDSFLFGRGGEEVASLRSAGLDVEVVPGITSGLAAPAAVGISVTHRESSPGVVFITGHEKDEAHERVDWTALAASGLTLVIYMGIGNRARIQQRLLDAGMSADTPVAAVQHATLPTQRVAAGTLAGLVAMVDRERIGSPAILIIGEVARSAGLQALAAPAPERAPGARASATGLG